MAGSLFVYLNNFVSPLDIWILPSAEAFLMVALGGPGTLFGPAIGAGAIVFLENFLSDYTERWLLILGIIYVVVVLFAPKGIFGIAKIAVAPQDSAGHLWQSQDGCSCLRPR